MVEYEPKSWLSLITNVRGSVLRGIAGRVLAAAALGVAAVWLHEERGVKVPPIAHTLIGAALALLLVFRTNASYDRYWEGRRLFGTIGNRMRDLSRQLAGLAAAEREEAEAIVRLLGAFFRLAVQGLRGERDLGALGPRLTDAERAALEPVRQRHYVVTAWIAGRLRGLRDEGALDPVLLAACDANLTVLVDSIGGAERIRSTPVPFAYAQHIKLFVTLFCFSVPFAMADAMRWYTPVASAVLAFALFGIDEIGVEIEEPFGYDPNDLPLDAIGDGLERTMLDVVATPPPEA